MATTPPETPASKPRTWLGPFAYRPFTVVWIANALALVGISINDTASGWLITTLDKSPLEVSLVHAATTLPMFLFTLPAGALADIVDPRRLILYMFCGITVLIAFFATLVSLDLASTVALIATTFVLSAAWSVNAPAWLAVLPSLAPRSELPDAMAAHGVAYNVSRTIGPAIGGLIIASSGLAAPYWVFSAISLIVIAALLWWRVPPKETAMLPAERLTSAVRTGIRHAANNPLFRATIVRTVAIYGFTAAYLGLLPLIARASGGGAQHFGLLVSTLSLGAIVGLLINRLLRRFLDLDLMVALGSVGAATTLVLFGSSHAFPVVLGAALIGGAAWVIVLTNLYLSAQNGLPHWVRGRGLAIFLTVIFGVVAAASAAWGQAAAMFGLDRALIAAAIGALIAIPLTWPWKLQKAEAVDLTPSHHYKRLETIEEIDDHRGPVLVTVEYRIDPSDRERFLAAIDELGEQRRRDGAFAWGVFEDMAQVGRFEEGYMVESWLELMHFRERVTNEDRLVEDEIQQMLTRPPHIEFLVAADRESLPRWTRAALTGA